MNNMQLKDSATSYFLISYSQ